MLIYPKDLLSIICAASERGERFLRISVFDDWRGVLGLIVRIGNESPNLIESIHPVFYGFDTALRGTPQGEILLTLMKEL